MNETPRLRSAFPHSPQTDRRRIQDGLRRSFGGPNSLSFINSPQPSPPIRPLVEKKNDEPVEKTVIPLKTVDAPTQRAYVAAIYLALLAWKLSNYWQIFDDLDSTWYFLKWVVIDLLFLFGLPALHIPWLEYSFFTTVTLFLLHFVADAFLMFRLPIPIAAFGAWLLKLVYDKELSITDHRVNAADILHSSSIILGKQVIQVLPEGSAILNPGQIPLYLGAGIKSVDLPIQINQTSPSLIELIRYDLDTFEPEEIKINTKQARQLKKQADKLHPKSEKSTPRLLKFAVKKTGLYQLKRVVDDTKLEVRIKNLDALVGPAPEASLQSAKTDRCNGDLSDLSLQVTGVPPFKVTYSKQINNQQAASSVQTVQPTGLESPLVTDGVASALVDQKQPNLEWARPVTVTVPINESLSIEGTWSYRIDQIEDGPGNVHRSGISDSRDSKTFQRLTVHRRPKLSFFGCSSQDPITVARRDSANFPLRLESPGQFAASALPLEISYTFVPETGEAAEAKHLSAYLVGKQLSTGHIKQPGRYELTSVATQFCQGEISEPSSCQLVNPPEPTMTVTTESLLHKCPGKSVGLRADLDFTGTPPFTLHYNEYYQGKPTARSKTFKQLRGDLEFKPSVAGSYEYEFLTIKDAHYADFPLSGENMRLKQDIKPPASAKFEQGGPRLFACLGQQLDVNVNLLGDGPWTVDYELFDGSKRKKLSFDSEKTTHRIELPPFTTGGQQSLILTNIRDKSQCSQSIREELQIDVRQQVPSVAFGEVSGKRSIEALEGKAIKLPLRLQGKGPWEIDYVNQASGDSRSSVTIRNSNEPLTVYAPGVYELLSVRDNSCPGEVKDNAATFDVSWITRPGISIPDSSATMLDAKKYKKEDVCQGDVDHLKVSLSGNPPYSLRYDQRSVPQSGQAAFSNKPALIAATGSVTIPMDSSKAGRYTYTFQELSDNRYAFSKQHFTPLTVEQQVLPLPRAKFSSPGQTYSYCKDVTPSSADTVPITLQGTPPFSLEIGITHQGNARPEIIRLKDLQSNTLDWTLPRRTLSLGTHSVSIRSVKDGRGCGRTLDTDPSSVRIRVSDPPTILPLESKTDYCVGEHVSFALSGQPSFTIFYDFKDQARRATSPTTTFRRVVDGPGNLTITGISDSAPGKCRAEKDIRKEVHPMPSVRIGRGGESRVEIHEGDSATLEFQFTGTPPFEFT